MRKKRPTSQSPRSGKLRSFATWLALAIGVACYSNTELPSLPPQLVALMHDMGLVLRQQTQSANSGPAVEQSSAPRVSSTGFSACSQFFAKGTPPALVFKPTDRALCFDAFAVLHSGDSKTPVYVAERLNRATIRNAADEERTDKFYPEARLRTAERATLEDYKASGYDRGHMAPAADMPTPQAMAQSFSLANMVPQAPEHNRGAWATTVESATRKYASRARGNVYVITGPVYAPGINQSPAIGPGRVRVPKYLFKLVYDETTHRAWAHWHLNADSTTTGSPPISYSELVKRTGIDFLPGVNVDE